MSVDPDKISSRRRLLTGAAAGVGALAVGAVAGPRRVRADDGNAVLQGTFNTAQSTTTVAINSNTSSNALVGAANNSGTGLWGSSPGGSGVKAESTNGFALETLGRLKIGTSGVAVLFGGTTQVTLNPGVDLTDSSFVLLTPRVNLGGRDLWYTIDTAANIVRFRISSSRRTNTRIGWLLLG